MKQILSWNNQNPLTLAVDKKWLVSYLGIDFVEFCNPLTSMSDQKNFLQYQYNTSQQN